MSKGWSPVAAVVSGVLIWLVGWATIDWLVLQLYPLPPGMWGKASMRDIIASRPDTAVALNLGGDLLVLTLVAFMASRQARGRTAQAGVMVTVVVLLLAIANSLATANFRWLHAVGFSLYLLLGFVAAKRGAETI
jgi:hypothetical protein